MRTISLRTIVLAACILYIASSTQSAVRIEAYVCTFCFLRHACMGGDDLCLRENFPATSQDADVPPTAPPGNGSSETYVSKASKGP
jgi:hypothetical protein